MYEFFDHTADLGLRVRSDSLEGLFGDAARGLFAMIVENPPRGDGREVEIRIVGDRRDYLLFDWLNELLYRFETDHAILGDFAVRLDEKGLTARAREETLDASRHRLIREVKAITYHHLKVVRTADGWLAELIVDI